MAGIQSLTIASRSSLQLFRATRRMCARYARHRPRRCCRPRETQQQGYGRVKAAMAGPRLLSSKAMPALSTLPPHPGLQMGPRSPSPAETTASSTFGNWQKPRRTPSGHSSDTLEMSAVSMLPKTAFWLQARGMRECLLADYTVCINTHSRLDHAGARRYGTSTTPRETLSTPSPAQNSRSGQSSSCRGLRGNKSRPSPQVQTSLSVYTRTTSSYGHLKVILNP